ncbi:MAG: DUF922 domain-containing protein [Pseudomonadota bacterium]
MVRAFLLIVTLTLAGFANPGPAMAQRFSDYPETSIYYYEVTGKRARAVRADINRKRPAAFDGGTRFDARANYYFSWTTRGAGPRCSATLMIDTSVRFPKLAASAQLSRKEQAKWDTYVDALEAHEVGHIALAYEAMPDIRAALEDGPCDLSSERAKVVLDELAMRQQEFDRVTDHGRKTGSTFP